MGGDHGRNKMENIINVQVLRIAAHNARRSGSKKIAMSSAHAQPQPHPAPTTMTLGDKYLRINLPVIIRQDCGMMIKIVAKNDFFSPRHRLIVHRYLLPPLFDDR